MERTMVQKMEDLASTSISFLFVSYYKVMYN